nr:zinc ribbon domain-containing protein [Candidatus Freyarchaeota archaeon]
MILTQLTYKTDYSQEQIITQCRNYLKKSGYQVKQNGNTLEAKGGRDISKKGWALYFLAPRPIADAYLWTRTRNIISVEATSKGTFTIMWEGRRATEDALKLCDMLRCDEVHLEESYKYCPHCGATLLEGDSYCAECGQEIL